MSSSINSFIDSDYFQTMSGLVLTDPEKIILDILIDSVMDIMEGFCGRKLKARNFSYDSLSLDYDFEYSIFDGPKGEILRLPTYPINSVNEIFINDVEILLASKYDDLNGYFLYPLVGEIFYSEGFSNGYNQNVKISWNGGYSSSHKAYVNLQNLNYLLVKKLWDDNSSEDDPSIISESIGNYRYTKMSPQEMSKLFGLPLWVFHNLGRFKRGTIA